MLTGELVRAVVRKGKVRPSFVDPGDDELLLLAEEVIALFGEHVGERREVLEEALREWVGDTRDFQLLRGLARLVEDRATFTSRGEMDPVELRRALFEEAAAAHPVRRERDALHEVTRGDIVARVAERFGLSPEGVEATLYSDLKGEERLESLREVTAEELLLRYNAGLVQALLLRASQLVVEVRGSARQVRAVIRQLKFRQLMFRAEPLDAGGWRLVVDGPMSLFHQSQRYGLQLALFFPALLSLPGWRLEAEVEWGRRRELRRLEAEPDPRLRPWRRTRGAWRSREQALLEERLAEKGKGWAATEEAVLLDLGGEDVLVPDLTLTCGRTGRVAHVEIFGFWRKDYLERRLGALERHGPENLILCISRKLAGSRESLGALGENVVEFAEVIPLGKVLAQAERVGSRAR